MKSSGNCTVVHILSTSVLHTVLHWPWCQFIELAAPSYKAYDTTQNKHSNVAHGVSLQAQTFFTTYSAFVILPDPAILQQKFSVAPTDLYKYGLWSHYLKYGFFMLKYRSLRKVTRGLTLGIFTREMPDLNLVAHTDLYKVIRDFLQCLLTRTGTIEAQGPCHFQPHPSISLFNNHHTTMLLVTQSIVTHTTKKEGEAVLWRNLLLIYKKQKLWLH